MTALLCESIAAQIGRSITCLIIVCVIKPTLLDIFNLDFFFGGVQACQVAGKMDQSGQSRCN